MTQEHEPLPGEIRTLECANPRDQLQNPLMSLNDEMIDSLVRNAQLVLEIRTLNFASEHQKLISRKFAWEVDGLLYLEAFYVDRVH